MNERDMEIGARIKEARKLKGLTLKEIGEMIGRTESLIARYEKGKVEIPRSGIDNLAAALNVDANYLLYGQTTEESKQQYRAGAAERHEERRKKDQATREYYKALGYSVEYRGDDYIIREPDGTEIIMDSMREMPLYDDMVSSALEDDAEIIHKRAVKKLKG